MKWLVTGVSGLLGANAALGLDGDVVGLARRALPDAPVRVLEADLAVAADRAGVVERSGAEAVFHAAAISTLEASERDPELTHAVNVGASADLAAQAASAGAAFVYVSTDAVFNGGAGNYTEEDPADPTSVYGATKLAGEQAVLAANPGALVARVNFYGWSPSGRRSLAEYFVNALERDGVADGFDDQVVSTGYAGRTIEDIEALVRAQASGIVHVASGEPVTKFEFGRMVAIGLGFDAESVRAVGSGGRLALRRGRDLSLNTGRMESLLGRSSAGQQEGVDRLVADRAAGRPLAVRAFTARPADERIEL